jgi:hypothetical protein
VKTFVTLLAVSAAVNADVRFQQKSVCEGHTVYSVKTVDYNADGLQDLIYSADRGVMLALAPDYQPIRLVTFPDEMKAFSYHSAVRDVDGDGDLDFVAENRGLYWLECPDRPLAEEWKLQWITKAFDGIHSVSFHDVDEDGKPDLVVNSYYHKGQRKTVPNEYPASILWYPLPSDPTRTDAWKPYVLADSDAKGGSHYIRFGDLDGDGHDEAFHGAKGRPFWWGNRFAYWKRPGDATQPWKKKTLPGRHKGATYIQAGDLNGDGKMDLVGSCGHGKGIVMFPGPAFEPEYIDRELAEPHAFEVADLDRDGDLDLVCCAKGSNAAVWFENNGQGTFHKRMLSDRQKAYEIVVSDLDGDGDLDLVVAGEESENIALFFQKTGEDD